MAVDTLALALFDDQVASSVRFEVLLSWNTPVSGQLHGAAGDHDWVRPA